MKVLVTGASQGIGLELARQYAAAGATVWGTVRRHADADELTAAGVCAPQLEVTDGDSVEELSRLFEDSSLDLLINNAGILGPERQSTTDMDFAAFADVLAVNAVGPLRVTQALLPALRRSGRPQLTMITSRMGSMSHAESDLVAYRASKAAANKITQCLATDLAPAGIVVSAVHPGWVRTNIGGDQAGIDVATSAAGIRQLLARLTPADTGQFWDYSGTRLPW